MKKLFFLIIFLITLSVASVSPTEANYMYESGGPSRQIVLDKQVKPDRWEDWQDNLSADKYVFITSDRVDYQIKIKNSGDEELFKVRVTDNLPNHISFLSGTEGYTQNGQEIKWEIEKIYPGEEKTFWIEARINDDLEDKSGLCLTNRAYVQVESGENDEDTAEICLEGRVLGAESLPAAGVNLAIVAGAGLTVSFLGLLLKKKQ